MSNRKICEFVLMGLFLVSGVVLLTLSFWAITSVVGSFNWTPTDYWLAWFSAISAVLSIPCLIAGVVATAGFLDGLCND